MSEVCHDVCVEPTLQPLTGEQLSYATAYREDSARLDVRAGAFWGLSQQSAFLMYGFLTPVHRLVEVSRWLHATEDMKERSDELTSNVSVR